MSGIKSEGEGDHPADAPAEDRGETPAGDTTPGDAGGTRRKASDEEGVTSASGEATSQEQLTAAVREGLRVAVNIFNDKVGAQGATFGFGLAGQAEAASAGPMPEASITAAVERYVHPGPYEEALGSLRSDGVVILAGAVGLGKRTGALALLRDVLPSEAPIVSLPPTADLQKLADRDYETGYGYVVFDWFGADLGRGAEHTWQRVCARMREANAYLIVTVTERPRRAPESVQYIAWRCPALDATLRAHLGDAALDTTIKEIVEHLPPETAMADIVHIANAVSEGAQPQSAVDEVLDQSERREVTEWFERKPTRRSILDITTLAFLVGVDERAFDTGRSRLEAALDHTMPVREPATPDQPAAGPTASDPAAAKPDDDASAPAAEPTMPQDRQQLRGNRLITLDREMVDGVARRALVFREEGFHRYVLEELADRYGVGFWDAVRSWLAEIVADETLRVPVANGLALLAYSAFDEIEASYLDPWAAGEHGWAHRHTAVFALWFMCFDEALVPVALRTTVRWATRGNTEQRRTAVIAFSGDLGVRHPYEAVNRLWQLIAQHNDLSEMAVVSVGNLFATLIARKAKAGLVIQLVSSRLRKASPYGKTRIRYRWTLRAALAVVEARNPVTGRPAIAEYLAGDPGRIATVGQIWAALLKHRPARHAALEALLKALRALEPLSDDAERDAKALGDALGEALPEAEHATLTTDFTKLARRAGARHQRSDALAQIMLAALERAHRRNPGGVS